MYQTVFQSGCIILGSFLNFLLGRHCVFPHSFICFLGDQGSPCDLHHADQYPAPHPNFFPKAHVGLISLYFWSQLGKQVIAMSIQVALTVYNKHWYKIFHLIFKNNSLIRANFPQFEDGES